LYRKIGLTSSTPYISVQPHTRGLLIIMVQRGKEEVGQLEE